MTGEMGWGDLKDYPDMLELAKSIQHSVRVAAEVRPFDTYQGPRIAVDLDRAPVQGASHNKLSSWNAEVWYSRLQRRYVIQYRGKYSAELTARNVVKELRKMRELRHPSKKENRK